MQQWEYKVEEIYDVWDSENRLNIVGRDGWELVGIYRESLCGVNQVYAVFKRPKYN